MLEENPIREEQAPAESGEMLKKKGGDTKSTSDKLSYLNIFEQVTPEELNEIENMGAELSEMFEDFDSEADSLREGKIVKGTVYSISDKEIILDVGFKSEGTIPIDEFANCAEVKKGDVFDVFLEKMENQDGLIVLSKERADFLQAWDDIKDAYDIGKIVKTTVDRRIKGGLVVKLMGVDAFLPGSQIALRQVPNLDELLGQDLECKIIKLNKSSARKRKSSCSRSWKSVRSVRVSSRTLPISALSSISAASTACCTSPTSPGEG
jgi:ribosomal protein S1